MDYDFNYMSGRDIRNYLLNSPNYKGEAVKTDDD
jgi:hypothetical protein